jgi:citrate synthase
METKGFSAGLEGVVAAETRMSDVDGEAGRLIIAGFPVEEIAPKASFEELAYLLWHDRLPNATEIEAFREDMASRRDLPEITLQVLRAAAQRHSGPMDALRMAVATLSLESPIHQGAHAEARCIVAKFPTIVAAFWRLRNGEEPIAPRTDLRHAANYLYMLTGKEPTEEFARAVETYMNTVSDHAMNASTFAARVIIATRSDMVSAITGAVGALKGPLHGGAPGPALDMVFEIRDVDRAEAYLRDKLGRGERIMGFGHRIYKVRDPRTDVLAAASQSLFENGGNAKLYELAMHVESTTLRLLEEYKPGRRLKTNVEFYTALLLHGLGFDAELFTPTFAIGRVIGWIGHCFEQQRTGKLIRPQSHYIGEVSRKYVPISER